MTENPIYWVWLQGALGMGSQLPMLLHDTYPGGLEGFYRSGPAGWQGLAGISPWQLRALSAFTLKDARSRLLAAAQRGWRVLTPGCDAYPLSLRHIFNPPAVLYVQGHWPQFSSAPAVGLVGAREATRYSQKAAGQIARELAAGGAIVVSGSAAGVDCCALSGALGAGGQVVSVLPVDLGSPYMRETAWLRREIVQRGGALVTEAFCCQKPSRASFHLRNRLITGLCFGVVLVQARLHSGTMIYASSAADQGREVFVCPGPPQDPDFHGSALLLSEGAIPVYSGKEVLSHCPPYYWDNAT